MRVLFPRNSTNMTNISAISRKYHWYATSDKNSPEFLCYFQFSFKWPWKNQFFVENNTPLLGYFLWNSTVSRVISYEEISLRVVLFPTHIHPYLNYMSDEYHEKKKKKKDSTHPPSTIHPLYKNVES